MKNHLTTLTLLSVLLLSLASCDEGSNNLLPYTIIEGQVLEYGTNEPVENAEVLLYKRISTGAFTGTDIRVDTAITNAAGEYSFQYEDSDKLGLFASADTYFTTNGIEYSNIRSKKMNTRNITLDPVAALELHIKNVNPFDNDNIRYSAGWENGASIQDNIGENIDKKEKKQTRGNRLTKVSWTVFRDNNIQTYTDSVYCKGHELTQYEIFY